MENACHSPQQQQQQCLSWKEMKVLVACRGPIAEEVLNVMHTHQMRKPHLVISRREWLDHLEGQAPWLSDYQRVEQVHVIDEYSDLDSIVEVVEKEGIEAIYVGYGFLAENVEFAQRCEQMGVRFVGPSSRILELLGLKDKAREICQGLDIPVTIGSPCLEKVILMQRAQEQAQDVGENKLVALLQEQLAEITGGKEKLSAEVFDQALLEAQAKAARFGQDLFSEESLTHAAEKEVQRLWQEHGQMPIRIKASAGGGGKGQRVVEEVEAIAKGLREVWSEIGASKVGGNKSVILEANLVGPRHMEVQILGDGEDVVHFGIRDCSLQTPFYQKLVEIAVHEGQVDEILAKYGEKLGEDFSQELEQERQVIRNLQDSAVRIGRHLGYRAAGTVEFLVDRDRNHYFLEVNPRIQVEHGVSEEISRLKGQKISLVAEQLRLTAGEKLGYTQEEITFQGNSLETRISLLDSSRIQPAPGATLDDFFFDQGQGIRIEDSGIARSLKQGRQVAPPPFYDANISLNIYTHAEVEKMLDLALENLRTAQIKGENLRTTIPFHIAILSWLRHNQPLPRVSTAFVEVYMCLLRRLQEQIQQQVTPLLNKWLKENRKSPMHTQHLLTQIIQVLEKEPALGMAFLVARRQMVDETFAPLVIRALAHHLNLWVWQEDEEFLQQADEFYQTLQQIVAHCQQDPKPFFASLEQQKLDENTQGVAKKIAEIERVTLEEAWQALSKKWQHFTCTQPLVSALQEVLRSCEFDQVKRHSDSTAIDLPESIADANERKKQLKKILVAARSEDKKAITSPTLGMFYRASKPGAKPYVEVGQHVKTGQTLGLVGAMKVYTEVQAHCDGVIKEVVAEDESLVQEGQTLMTLE